MSVCINDNSLDPIDLHVFFKTVAFKPASD